MNKFKNLLFTIVIVFFLGWVTLVSYSYLKLGHLQPQEDSDGSLPPFKGGDALLGARVYASEGCATCHTQQVRQTDDTRSDIDRQWGKRPSVARDYLRSNHFFLGESRLGPDLSNIGMRKTDPVWFYQHLYDPSAITPDSIMPSYRYLFTLKKREGASSSDALVVKGNHQPKEGYEIIPTQKVKNLVSYLLSLKQDYSLPEVPPVAEK